MKKLFTLFILTLLPMLASANAIEIDGIYYNLDSEAKTAEVTSKPDRYKDDVIIPETVRYNETIYNVNTIGWAAFNNCSGLTSVTIPNSVTFIDNGAFYGCSGLTSVTIGSSVTSIGEWAFSGCIGLTSVKIPNSVTEIGDYAFQSCTSLTSITIPSSVTSIGKYSFFDCSGLKSIAVENGNPVYDSRESCKALIKTSDNELILGCMNSTIPNSVTRIGQAAFQNCKRLLSVRIPNSVVSVGQNAFYNCSGLTSVTIPNSVTSIGEAAFRGCSGLTSITIPNSVTSIGEYVFYNCSGLISVTIPNSVTFIGLCAFAYCSGLTSVTIPNSVTFIDNHAFQFCSGLTSITIGSGTITIGDQVFACCPELKDVYCYAKSVPYTYADSYSNAFKDSSIEYATLHVPAGSVSAYQAVKPWKNFKEIVALPSKDDYRPFVEEGKVWTYHYQGFNGREFNVGRVIDDDTIIGGLTYKKIYDKIGGQYQYALREEGKKIYIVHPHYETASLLYDFGKNAGDVIDELEHPLIVASVDTIDIDGVKFRRMRVQDAGQPVEKWSNDLINMYNFWIEGVGSESLLETSIREPGNAYNLLSCQINGRVYTQQELLGIVSNPTPQDDYRPFVKVGKKWNVIRSDFDGDYHHINYRLTNEKVEKAGKTYMKMYRREGYSAVADDERLLREENRKVYIFDPDLQKEFLLFDYSLKAGDTYETYSYDEQKMVSYKVVSVRNFTEGPESIRYDYDEERDSMITQRRYLRKWTVCRTDDNSIQKTWIESVGSLEGPLANLYARPISFKDDLAYVEDNYYYYLPFSFHNEFSHVHGCNLPTGAEDYKEDDERHKLTYELEGNRLHVYGKAFTQCGPNNYAYFYEKKTDDPLVNKIQFVIQEAEPMADCMALHATNFYVPGFDPNMNYIVIDNQGEEHPVINKTPQMDYRPLVEEGKVWKVGTIPTALDSPVQVVDYYYFDGDTIIGGKTCKQMMRQRYVSPNYTEYDQSKEPSLRKVGAWYEENKKVYMYDEREQTMTLKYDFSLEANDTLHFLNEDGFPPFIIGPKQIGGLEGFKGVYREIMIGKDMHNTIWLEGVGVRDAPFRNAYDPRADLVPEFLISCTVGDEVIYLNDRYEDGATPESMGARKNRFDFTHTIKTKPKARKRSEEEPLLYGEYNDLKLGINLNPLDDAYQVRITDDSGKVVYEKVINAGNIVGLNIDISAYAKGRYTVTVENSDESFTGEFNAQGTGIESITSNKVETRPSIYNLQGQRLSSLQKGLNIVNGQKIFVK